MSNDNSKKTIYLKKFIPVFFFLIIFALIITFTITTIAQNVLQQQSLEVSPPAQEISVDPGKSLTVKAKVRNKSKNTLPMKVRVEDFTATGEEGQVALVNAGKYSLSYWTTLTPESFSLKPGEEQEVIATIQVPQSAGGGRYGSFVFSVVPPGAKAGEAAVSQEIASLFLMRIAGPVNESLILTELKAPEFSEFGPIPFSLKFQNNGNIHVKTYGLINVTNMFKQKVADIVVTGTNIFPGNARILNATLKNKLLFGNYTATAIMYYGSTKNQTLTLATSFFVFPVRLVAVIVIVLFLLYLIRKRLKKALKDLIG